MTAASPAPSRLATRRDFAGYAVAVAAIYGTAAVGRNEALAATPADAAGLITGQMQSFVLRKAPEAIPEFKFVDGAGKERSLKDWRGKVVLLNLWATWCAPCRKEMPALDRLQRDLGSDKFEVLTLSIDRGGIEASRKFLDQIKVEKLGLYVDPTAKLGSQLRVIGLPATLLIDAEGREIGRLLGPAEWDGEDAKRLITAFLR